MASQGWRCVLLQLFFCTGVLAQSEKTGELSDVQLNWSRGSRPSLDRQPKVLPPVVPRDNVGRGAPGGGGKEQWAISMADKTLYRAMRRWAAQANYQLLWQVDRDFPIESDVVFEGDFRAAVGEVMSSVSMTDFPLQAILNTKTKVLRVVRYLEERTTDVGR